MMQVVDLCLLDYDMLKYNNRYIIAVALYFTIVLAY